MALTIQQAFNLIANSAESIETLKVYYETFPTHYLKSGEGKAVNGRYLSRNILAGQLDTATSKRVTLSWLKDLSSNEYRKLALTLKRHILPAVHAGSFEDKIVLDWIANPYAEPCPDTGEASSELLNENKEIPTMSSKYSETPIAKPTYIFGRDTADMTEADYLAAIRKLNSQINSYGDIPDSKRVSAIVKDLTAQRDKIVALFDKS